VIERSGDEAGSHSRAGGKASIATDWARAIVVRERAPRAQVLAFAWESTSTRIGPLPIGNASPPLDRFRAVTVAQAAAAARLTASVVFPVPPFRWAIAITFGMGDPSSPETVTAR